MTSIKGYAFIDKAATTCKGAENPEEFKGEICRVLDFDDEGGVLALEFIRKKQRIK